MRKIISCRCKQPIAFLAAIAQTIIKTLASSEL